MVGSRNSINTRSRGCRIHTFAVSESGKKIDMTDSSTGAITRFAPSPTGFLHIGGARTALFNWLLARNLGGTYLLRVEDTDRARSTDEAIKAIVDGLDWLGLGADGEPTFQFERQSRHQEVVDELLAQGHAYRCYCSPEELQSMRETAAAEGRPPIYDGRWRDRAPSEAPDGVAPAIRLKSATVGETIIDDKVQDEVTFQNANLDDLIILRSDGTPTYNLAVVVDDHDMGVTHVLRGVDHLTNTARQVQIYRALNWPVPVFAHVPLIHGADGAKLSKRHGALGVEAYRAMGFLPDALKNYLVRLGWSHGDQEVFSEAEMVSQFGFEGLGKSAARFDVAKLDDHDMGVTHVLRGVDHLTNTARQVQIYRALNWPVPVFAHVPLIHGADGAKLSKRHGALGVEAYRAMGFLPDALKNYLVRLGWSHGDQEVFSEAEMVSQFGFEGLGKSAARFDVAKLEDLNGQYIRKMADKELIEHLKVLFGDLDDGAALNERYEAVGYDRLEQLMPAIKERAKTLHDLIDNSRFLVAERPLSYSEKAAKLLDDDAKARLAGLLPAFEALSEWTVTAVEAAIRDYTTTAGYKLGQVAQPLRAAITGEMVSTPIFDAIATLPKEEALNRLRDAI